MASHSSMMASCVSVSGGSGLASSASQRPMVAFDNVSRHAMYASCSSRYGPSSDVIGVKLAVLVGVVDRFGKRRCASVEPSAGVVGDVALGPPYAVAGAVVLGPESVAAVVGDEDASGGVSGF